MEDREAPAEVMPGERGPGANPPTGVAGGEEAREACRLWAGRRPTARLGPDPVQSPARFVRTAANGEQCLQFELGAHQEQMLNKDLGARVCSGGDPGECRGGRGRWRREGKDASARHGHERVTAGAAGPQSHSPAGAFWGSLD